MCRRVHPAIRETTMSRLANGRPQTGPSGTMMSSGAAARVGTSFRPSSPSRKKFKPASAQSRKRMLFGHQDARSFAIMVIVAVCSLVLVGGVWWALQMRTPAAPVIASGARVLTGSDIAAKRTNIYWRETHGVYHQYYTDPVTGHMVDAGEISVDDMIKKGVEVPGYERKPEGGGGSSASNQNELAIRFKAIRDHLN